MLVRNQFSMKQKFIWLFGFVGFTGLISLVLVYKTVIPLEPSGLMLMGLLLFNILGAITIGALILGSTQASMKKVISAIGDFGEGDLEQRLDIQGTDEMAQLSACFNAAVDKIQILVESVNVSSLQLSSTAEETSTISNDAYEHIRQQQYEIEQITTAIEKIAATGFTVGMNASSSMEKAEKAAQDAGISRNLVDQTVDSINGLATEVEKSSDVINKVEDDVKQIGKILVVIRDVSGQTNLLALNAAIEAARAGEMGRGFAVVADEVRSLAKRTQDSTHEIQEMIDNLQSNAQAAVTAMNCSREKAAETVMHAAGAGTSLEQITVESSAISKTSQDIVSELEGQNQMITGLGANLVNIGEKITSTTLSAKQTVAASNELARFSAELQNMVQHFKVNAPQSVAILIPEAPSLGESPQIVEATSLEEPQIVETTLEVVPQIVETIPEEDPFTNASEFVADEPPTESKNDKNDKNDDMDFFI